MTYYHGRLLCDVLEEMRSCCKTLNFAILPGLIEEAQVMGSRMEAALDAKKSHLEYADSCKTILKQRSKLQKELDKLSEEIDNCTIIKNSKES